MSNYWVIFIATANASLMDARVTHHELAGNSVLDVYLVHTEL